MPSLWHRHALLKERLRVLKEEVLSRNSSRDSLEDIIQGCCMKFSLAARILVSCGLSLVLGW